jgi:hypothetical protein
MAAARAEYNRQWALNNRERRRASARTWAANNPERRRELDRKSYAANRAERLVKARAAYDPVKNHEHCKRWRTENPAKALALSKKRKAALLRRTPKWADLKKIEKVYEESRLMGVLMGEPWHVDHVIPLRGRKVSGLHVHGNLQIMPGVENMKKYNKFEVA